MLLSIQKPLQFSKNICRAHFCSGYPLPHSDAQNIQGARRSMLKFIDNIGDAHAPALPQFLSAA